MLSKGQVRHLHSLRMAKFREESAEFLAEGDKLARELLSGNFRITGIYALPGWLDRNRDLLTEKENLVVEVTDQDLEKISNLVTPQEIVVTAGIPESREPRWEELPGPLLVLDHIQDPGNFGTIIRCADWFGFSRVICSNGTVELYNPKVIQATMGSFLRVEVHYTELESFLAGRPAGRRVLGTYAGGDNLFKTTLDPDAVFIIGNESRGISGNLEPWIDQRIGIPAFSQGVESLNASVAAAIMMAEFRRAQSDS